MNIDVDKEKGLPNIFGNMKKTKNKEEDKKTEDKNDLTMMTSLYFDEKKNKIIKNEKKKKKKKKKKMKKLKMKKKKKNLKQIQHLILLVKIQKD